MTVWQYCLKEKITLDNSVLSITSTISEIFPWINVFWVGRDIFKYFSFIIVILINLIGALGFHYMILFYIVF